MNHIAPRIYADFHNADPQGRVRLTCTGTTEDLLRQKIDLREGLAVTLYADDLDAEGRADELVVDGTVAYSGDEHCWVAVIDWSAIKHESEIQASALNGSAPRNQTKAR